MATAVIQESHEYWLDLMKGKTVAKKINREQTSNPKWCKTYVEKAATTEKFGIPAESRIDEAAKKPEKYQYWYYLDEEFKLIELPGQKV
jgi:inorganic pyrophosphatase